jgi:two-component system, NtrC family, response regulator GlrR
VQVVRILIIDDDATFCRLLAEVLEARGHRVDWCDKPLQGYNMTQRQDYDVSVFDVRMPFLLGTELAEGLKQEHPAMKIILISAFADEALQKTADSLGLPLLSKPFATQRFIEFIEQQCAR